MVLITIVNGVYKPTYNVWGPHPVAMNIWLHFSTTSQFKPGMMEIRGVIARRSFKTLVGDFKHLDYVPQYGNIWDDPSHLTNIVKDG